MVYLIALSCIEIPFQLNLIYLWLNTTFLKKIAKYLSFPNFNPRITYVTPFYHKFQKDE